MRYNVLSFATVLCLLLSPLVPALFQDEAYHIDFHYPLLGAPVAGNTFFHKPSVNSKASLLYTLSEKGLLGAINPKDGSLVWRQDLADNAQNRSAVQGFLCAANNTNIVVSATGNKVRAWDATGGRMIWEREEKGVVRSLSLLEVDPMVVVQENGNVHISRLNGMNGKMIWEVTNRLVSQQYTGTSTPLTSHSDDVPLAMTSSTQSIFYVSLAPTLLKGYQVHVTEVEPNTAHLKSQYTLSSENEIGSEDSVVHIGSRSTAPIIAWVDKSIKTLKINILGKKEISTINIAKHGEESVERVSIHAPAFGNTLTHFLVHYRSKQAHWAEVYHIDSKKWSISKAYDLPKLGGKGAFAMNSVGAQIIFTRHTDFEITMVSSASHGILERWPVQQKATNASSSSQVIAAISEVVPKGPSAFAVRSIWTLDSGDVELVRNGERVWTRPESLSGIKCAIVIDPPIQRQLARELEYESHNNIITAYAHRVSRHLRDLKYFPRWLLKLPARTLTSFGIDLIPPPKNPESDSFGFQKTIIIATEKGRVIALDSEAQGSVIWNTQAIELASGSSWNVTDIHLDRAGILRITAPDLGRSIFMTLNGDIRQGSDKVFNVEEDDLIVPFTAKGGIVELALVSKGVPKIASILDLSDSATLITRKPDGSLAGWKVLGGELNQLWLFEPSEDESISDVVARPTHDPIASIGRPLGDRNVLYKFISPNILLITTLNSKASSVGVYLIDSISGQTLYTTKHDSVDTTREVKATFSENWFSYTVHLDPTLANGEDKATTPKSSVLVVSELYESPIPNDRGPLGSSGNISSLNSASYSPFVVSATYIIPSSLSSLATTSTKQGITPRSILAYSSSLAAILAIPVSLLSPRRPVGRDPTPSEREEGLMRYSPFFEFHPQWALSHEREVLGIKGIISTPSDMESTSLIFAYGDLDVFGTRVSPIGAFDMLNKGFGKLQLILTVVALAVGTGVLAPMVIISPSPFHVETRLTWVRFGRSR